MYEFGHAGRSGTPRLIKSSRRQLPGGSLDLRREFVGPALQQLRAADIPSPSEDYRGAVESQRRVGVFGGTFDPPHAAHVAVAAAAVHQLELDELIVTVAGVPWQKIDSRPVSPAAIRLRMAELAFSVVGRVVVSDIELRRRGNSYTSDTLRELAAPDSELFLLLGTDAAEGLGTWHEPEAVAELATIVVFPRRGFETAAPPPEFEWTALELPGLEISSSDIRRRVAMGEPIDGLVPAPVVNVVRSENLYVER